ncbi:MAG: 4-(cytidine 5'-diphospho)-2-C-methyl-D-erythritol kinase [Gammaproteobacteria bacterium]|nr:4-(cytidine 5'-diphospho)-2-C-methyl-D-erythritol kinase [Gammaproteobacteria bacterium]
MYQPLKCRSFAKLNLCLHVLNKRNDGYHEIESIFETINLYDELSFKQNNSNSIRFTSDSKKINPLDNLITKAYKEISDNYKITGIDVLLKKNIPIGAGLGGGSSNAAVTLHALNSLFKLNISSKKLMEIAQKICSDVPFFINGGSAIVRGRGEIIDKIDRDEKFYIIIVSDLLIHTKDIFENLRTDCYVNTVKNIDLLKSQHNCLENLVMSKYPALKETKYWLSSFGRVRMSGTGSTLYIEYDNYESAEKANREIGRKYKSLMVSSLKSYDVFS